jgi:tetratricopeptide (TPR) repeat protein
MTVRRQFFAVLALGALLLGAGCGGGSDALATAEVDDSYYQQGKALQRQGREAESLTAFLKVIERRGEQNAPESHLEAGLVYLNQVKNPIEALHHFNKYLELQPKSKEAPRVSGLINTAMKELARTISGRPLENQVQALNLRDTLENLQRENDQLKAEIASLRGTAAPGPSFLRVTRAPADGSAVPPPANNPVAAVDSPIAVAPAPRPATPLVPVTNQPATPPVKATRKHVVKPGENLYRIALKYGLKPEDIVAVNRELLPTVASPVKVGTELKIP